MSRAIPSSFDEYLLDQTSRNTGIVCDGGIMPLRNNPDTTSLQYRNCLRGEDIMFLQEAAAARRNDDRNDGLDDTSIKYMRPYMVQIQLGELIDSGAWTDTDPRAALGYHALGSSVSWESNIEPYILSCLNPIHQASAGDTYTTLDHTPVMNLFRDVKSLSYVIRSGGRVYSRYSGYNGQTQYTYHRYVRRYSSITSDYVTDNSYMWYQQHEEQHNPREPEGMSYKYDSTPLSCTTTFTEDSYAVYRRFHRYCEVCPFGVFMVRNIYLADDPDNDKYDQFSKTAYVLAPFPAMAFYDTQTATTITLNDQQAWQDWVRNVYDTAGLKQYATDVGSEYTPPTGPWRQIRQTSYIGVAAYTFWVMHMKYCSLDDVQF